LPSMGRPIASRCGRASPRSVTPLAVPRTVAGSPGAPCAGRTARPARRSPEKPMISQATSHRRLGRCRCRGARRDAWPPPASDLDQRARGSDAARPGPARPPRRREQGGPASDDSRFTSDNSSPLARTFVYRRH
jgi:hypothetical protein